MRRLCAIAIPLTLAGCLLPTPVSIVTTGVDVVSYAVSGKTVTDHGLSLAMGEDCALIRVVEGEICAEEPDYGDAVQVAVLEPLPDSLYGAQLAGADPQVLAAVERANLHAGGDEGLDAAPTQFAALEVAYLADAAQPAVVDQPADREPALPAGEDLLAAAPPPLPSRRPLAADAVPMIALAAIPARPMAAPLAEMAPVTELAAIPARPQAPLVAEPAVENPVIEFVALRQEADEPQISPREIVQAFQAELATVAEPVPAETVLAVAPLETSAGLVTAARVIEDGPSAAIAPADLDAQLATLFWDSGNSEVGDRPEVPVVRAPQQPRDSHLTVAERLSRPGWTETGG